MVTLMAREVPLCSFQLSSSSRFLNDVWGHYLPAGSRLSYPFQKAQRQKAEDPSHKFCIENWHQDFVENTLTYQTLKMKNIPIHGPSEDA